MGREQRTRREIRFRYRSWPSNANHFERRTDAEVGQIKNYRRIDPALSVGPIHLVKYLQWMDDVLFFHLCHAVVI